MSECKRCFLETTCRRTKLPFCPMILYAVLIAATVIPAVLLWLGRDGLNIG